MIFKFGKETLDIDIDETDTVAGIKERLKEVLSFNTIKLIHTGKVIHDDTLRMVSIPGGNNAKITVVATNSTAITESHHTSATTRVINDLDDNTNTSHNRTDMHIATKHTRHSEYRFHNIETLPNLPEREKALDILTVLANDPGVLAVMEKHKWSVGTLCELYPEGYVGVSDVCVMGLNENKGQRILLRLRTDDLKGFRKILSIKKVLYHELAHNVHSDHNGDFYVLMRQVEKEVALLDWRTSSGKTTGYESRYSSHSNTIHDRGDQKYYEQNSSSGAVGGTYRLGGGTEGDSLLQQLVPARYLAGTAAIMRLSAEEQEVEDNCGSGRGHSVHGVNPAGEGDDRKVTSVVSNDQQEPLETDTVVMEVVESSSVSSEAAPAVDAELVLSIKAQTADAIHTAVVESQSGAIVETNSDDRVIVDSSTTATTASPITAPAPVPTAVHQLTPDEVAALSSRIQSAVLSAIDDSISFALSLESSAAPIDKLLQLRTAIDTMLQSSVFSDMITSSGGSYSGGTGEAVCTVVAGDESVFLKGIKLLLKIVTNAKDNLSSTSTESLKFKTIKKTTNAFTRYIQGIPGATDVLYAAGFADTTDEGGVAVLRLTRQDPGLLYIVHSLLSNAVETVEVQLQLGRGASI